MNSRCHGQGRPASFASRTNYVAARVSRQLANDDARVANSHRGRFLGRFSNLAVGSRGGRWANASSWSSRTTATRARSRSEYSSCIAQCFVPNPRITDEGIVALAKEPPHRARAAGPDLQARGVAGQPPGETGADDQPGDAAAAADRRDWSSPLGRRGAGQCRARGDHPLTLRCPWRIPRHPRAPIA